MRVAAHNLEHVIDRRIDHLPMDGCGPLRKGLHHFLLLRGGLDDHRLIMHLRRRQMKLIRGLDVRDLTKDIHELRQVEELGKPRACPITGALRGQLNSRRCLSERRCPAVKMRHAAALQSAVLQVPLHGVQLGHGVADRCTRGKDDATSAGQLVHVAAFQVHVAGLLRFGSGNPGHVAHLRVQKKW